MTAINMAARWSSENVVAEHRDLQANAMAVDCTGQFVLLAGRRYLAIVDLDEPLETVKKIPRQSKWEVGAAEWNPNPSQANLFAIACNQRAELITWKESELASIHTLRSHTRVISDLNWSPFDPHLLATCSVDTYMYIWDVRDPRKPCQSFSAVAGATQIKWNKVTGNLLATAHEGDIRLWDHRKNTIPMQYIAAHLAKIHGLDWSPTQEYQLATSSQDCTVKFWDVTNPRRPEHVLQSDSPVWRARYTPFGEGLITVVVPQLRRGENSLLLWNTSNLHSHVHTFVGHTDVVLEFEWRSQKEEHRDFQLVTWSKDQSLRIWKIDSQLQKLCGYEVDLMEGTDTDIPAPLSDTVDAVDNTSQTSQTSPRDHDTTLVPSGQLNSSASTDQLSEQQEITLPAQPKNLQQEFSLVNINIPNVTVDEMDAVKRTCTVSAMSGKLVVRLLMSFPSIYPCNAAPTFQFCKGTTVDSTTKNKLVKVLRNTSQQHVKRNRSCLEPCLRQLISTLEIMSEKEGPDVNNFYGLDSSRAFLPSTNRYGVFQDVTVPFPRTSGANFCGAGYLVCFAPPTHMKRMATPGEITPRSLSALAAFVSNPMQSIPHSSQPSLMFPAVAQSPTGETGMLVSSYYYADRKQRFRGRSRKDGDSQSADQKSSKAGLAVIYDVSNLMSVSKELAEAYVFDHKDISGMCTRNATAAAAIGRRDLVQVWSMAALSASVLVKPNTDPDAGLPWAQHPFGRKLLHSLIDHYLKIRDIQTVAMLCCAFGPRNDSQPIVKKPSRCITDTATYSPGGSPYHTIHPGDTTMEGWNLSALLKTNRSNSWSDSLDDHDLHFLNQAADSKDSNCEKHDTNIRLLDPKQVHRYDEFKRAYAEILYHWNLLQERSDLLKYVSTVPPKHKGVDFFTECLHCKNDVRAAYCIHCKNYSFQCAICHIAVKGSSNFCLSCGHGGHTNHMEKWFIHHEYCPVGCGCYCLQESEVFGS